MAKENAPVKPDVGEDADTTIGDTIDTTGRFGDQQVALDQAGQYGGQVAASHPRLGATGSEGVVLDFGDGINTVPEMIAAGSVAAVVAVLVIATILGFTKKGISAKVS